MRIVTCTWDGKKGDAPAPHRPKESMTVAGDDLVRLEAKGVRLRDDSVVEASEDDLGLGTDAGIARRSKAGEYGRQLQAWDGGEVPEDLTLEATFGADNGKAKGKGKRGGAGAAGWDQFNANATQFGVHTTFDEKLYTTELQTPMTEEDRARAREAERLAREIEGTAATNVHQREERGQAQEKDYENMDEEDRFSSVMAGRTGGKAAGFDRTAAPAGGAAQGGQAAPPAAPATSGKKLSASATEFKMSAGASSFKPGNASGMSVTAKLAVAAAVAKAKGQGSAGGQPAGQAPPAFLPGGGFAGPGAIGGSAPGGVPGVPPHPMMPGAVPGFQPGMVMPGMIPGGRPAPLPGMGMPGAAGMPGGSVPGMPGMPPPPIMPGVVPGMMPGMMPYGMMAPGGVPMPQQAMGAGRGRGAPPPPK